MEWMGVNELRESFLKFMESKGCLRLQSFPLIPKDDNSLLLINSGMAPMKKYFTGEVTPPRTRVTTCQKCIRTPDIERVGITARHGTYFEMLGNFSFGDYFKREATEWAWEFFTEVLKMPKELLYVSVYQDDDEAYDIWTKERGVDPSHMVRMGKEDNFWEHGSGPCGPCSEIYFDRGEEKGCGSPDCKVGCECDRFVEVWNLVFTQFESDGNGNYTPLEHPNIDTGMGLERLACVMQGVDNLFLVDTVQNIMKHISAVTGVKYGEDPSKDISLRVITDHIRSTTFMIGDGVMPSNEGRGYVLRRLLRRAARHGRLLGYNKPFLSEICSTVIKENESAYPELKEKEEFIKKLIRVEEDNFAKTIEQGLAMLDDIITKGDIKTLSGEDTFKLNDTFGFPVDLTKEILAEKGIKVDTERFYELLAEQKRRSRDARKDAGADAWLSESVDLADVSATQFVGYTEDECDAKILALVVNGERENAAAEGDKAIVVLDKTPFYAESGGQVGDTGVILIGETEFEVTNTTKDPAGIFMHTGVVKKGSFAVDDCAKAIIDKERRASIMRNHTAAHLLQAALRKVLGNHVEQAGQLVTEGSVRFDFTHFSALTAKELADVESMVNEEIFKAYDVTSTEMPIAEAKKMGAMALFGEKYGDVVRVVKAGDFSVELCGGTHVDNTAKLCLFKIRQEGSVAAGVRRIDAVTGRGVLRMLENTMFELARSAAALKINSANDLAASCERIAEDIKAKDKKISELEQKMVAYQMDSLIDEAQVIGGVKVLTEKFEGVEGEMLKTMCQRVTDKSQSSAVLLASVNGAKLTFACAIGKDVIAKGIKAGELVKAAAQLTGGNGGGKPDMAMAGGKDASKVDEALAAFVNTVKEKLA
ncbi:MAG: alanine--tRNA ligase [Clostridia bacterium]|nr:alanine--tRNA ligase [Clostridia bacterium]